MTLHRLDPDRFTSTYGPHEPVLTVADGDEVEAAMVDAFGVDAASVQRASGSNPLVGPVAIRGAEPGDRLEVTVRSLTLDRDDGYGGDSLAPHVVDPAFVPRLRHGGARAARWRLDHAKGVAVLDRQDGPLAGWTLPLEPMLGCIGVAPPEGQCITSFTSGPHGGNMDARVVRAGATIVLPVFAEGALLCFGDAHACQGDGEISGTGIETSATVRLQLRLVKGAPPLQWPRGVDADGRFTLGNARPLDQATQHATTEMVRWLCEDYGLTPDDAGLFMSQTVRYAVGNVFDPAYTVVCRVPAAALAALA